MSRNADRVVGLGADLTDLGRMRSWCARFTDDVLASVFTEAELAQVRAAEQPWLRLGIGFATKEAAAKALGTGVRGFALTDVAAVVSAGAVRPVLTGPALAAATARGVGGWTGGWERVSERLVLVRLIAWETCETEKGKSWQDMSTARS